MTRRLAILLALAAGLGLAACAEMAAPPGGPVDRTPPAISATTPGSLATNVDPATKLSFTFTEKVDRNSAKRALVTVPQIAMKRPSFDDLTVTYEPERGWPPDTVVVWTLTTNLSDRHRVRLERELRGAFTTGESFPPGVVRGRARLPEASVVDTTANRRAAAKDTDWTTLRAELEVPPAEGERRGTPWRTAFGDDEGRFELPWLEIPSGPFDLRVYLDKNGNGNRDEREAVATVDSLFLAPTDSILTIDPARLVLIDLEAPVPVRIEMDSVLVDTLSVVAWFEVDGERRSRTAVADTNGVVVQEVTPGPLVWGAWVDVDGDGFFGPADSLGTSEAFAAAETLEVAPATPETLHLAWPDSVLPFAVVDTLPAPPVPRDLVRDPPVPE